MKKSLIRVGLFDSGIGGLTVLSECLKYAPQFEYIYYGDNANAPYGSRTAEEITGLVRTALKEFCRQEVDAAVLACNTATAVCAESMRKEFSFPIVGTEPAVKPAGEHCRNVLILATPRTAESKRLKTLIDSCPQCKFTVFPAKGLAAAIEGKMTSNIVFDLSDHLPEGEYDGIVLGCTHYIWIRKEIEDFYDVPVFDGNEGTAKRLVFLVNKKISGIDDHLRATDFGDEKPVKKVFFVGSGAKINRRIYKSEHMFQ